MCGIAGVFDDHESDPTRCSSIVTSMLARLTDRGPHGTRLRQLPDGCLGHTALPLARGSVVQPYSTASGRVTLTFNGELYNLDALRRALTDAGSDVEAACDTALVAELVEAYGPRAIEQLSGMFALAVWDDQAQTLTLARDRLGKKPLFYVCLGSASGLNLAFASELDALVAHPLVGAIPDLSQVPDYLVRRSVAAPASMISGVHKVGPGQVLSFTGRERRTWWQSFPAARAHPEGAGLGRLLGPAVQRRLAATDAPTGVLFSGGVDSSVVAALAVREGHRALDAFSVVFSAEEETEVAALAEQIGVRPRIWRPTLDEIGREARATLADLDEPMADPSLVVTRMAARLARDHAEIVLTGDGADELFFGYRYFEAQVLLSRLGRVPACLTRGAFQLLGSPAGRRMGLPLSGVATDLANSVGAPAHLGFLAAHAGASGTTLRSLLRRPDRPVQMPACTRSSAGASGPSRNDLMEQSRSAVFWSFLVDTVITKLDRSTMAYGLEARSPFLDDEVVALGLALQPADSGAGGVGKLPVRSLAAELCGEKAATRTKQGFRGPMAAVLRGPLQDLVRDVLDERALRDSLVWNARAVTRIVDQHMSGARVWTQVIWSVLVLESWLARVQRIHPEGVRR